MNNTESSAHSDKGIKFTTESYFSRVEGLCFIKVTNNNNKKRELSYNFKLERFKLIKPATNPHVINFKNGSSDIIGFIVKPGDNQQINYGIAIKTFNWP